MIDHVFDADLTAYRKYTTWAVYGRKASPALAEEVLRRTDTIFIGDDAPSEYAGAVCRHLGVPLADGVAGDEYGANPGAAFTHRLHEARDAYLRAWGTLAYPSRSSGDPVQTLRFFANAMAIVGDGWCFPDGTIALHEEIKRGYPTQIRDECRLVAEAFPDLAFSVAYWGDDGPEPTAGFRVEAGKVHAMWGGEAALFAPYGDLDHRSVLDVIAWARAQARASLVRETRFGTRDFPANHWIKGPVMGLPDEVIDRWAERAGSMGLLHR